MTNRFGAGQWTVSYGYDPAGNRTNLTDALGNETSWEYDSRNRVIRKWYADGTSWEFAYDGVGNLTNQMDALSNVVSFSYNDQNLRTGIDFASDPDVAIQYDALGRRTLLIDGSGTNEWVYDTADQILTNSQSRTEAVLSYGYDVQGNRTSMSYNGDPTSYAYDLAGRLTTLSNNLGNFTYAWHPELGQISSLTFPGGAMVTNHYDTLGRLLVRSNLNSTGTAVSSFAYSYDLADLATNVVHFDGASVGFAYDTTRQLNDAVGRSSGGMIDTNYQFSYQYDAMGNYAQISRAGAAEVFGVNDLNQYVTSSLPAAPSFSFDANGNLETAGGTTYTWDQADRLSELEDGANRTEYLHNQLGFLVERRVYLNNNLQDVRRYVYDDRLLLAELDGSNNVIHTYVHGLDLVFSFADAGGTGGFLARSTGGGSEAGYYFYDARGNVVDMLDPGDAALAHYEYDPFGRVLTASGAGASGNEIRFSTKRSDQVHGIVDFGFRFYDPQLGRWLNRDPIAERDSINLYAFVENNPVNQIDLLGLETITFKALGERLPQPGPAGFGEGEIYGATKVTEWEVKAKVRRCRGGGCDSKNKTFRLNITRCVGKGEWWWSSYKTGSEAHELEHVALFTDNWNAMVDRINGFAGSCGSKENAACRERLVELVRRFYRAKAHHENFEFDCQQYKADQAQKKVCVESKMWAEEMQHFENLMLTTEAECNGL